MRMSINTPEDTAVNEQFIKLVQDNPILWNFQLPQYRNREMKVQKWAQIGAPFNISGNDAYKKFVALREKYKREQKLRESKSISPNECWRLYENLKFLDTVSFSRDRKSHKPKLLLKSQNSFPNTIVHQDFASMIKTELSESQHDSMSTSPSYHMSRAPSENEFSETYQNSSVYFNESTSQENISEHDGGDSEEKMESIPVGSASSSHTRQFFDRLESKSNTILDDCNRRTSRWARCETLGLRVAQTMFALEENDPDLALKFDIILSEAISSIKKDQLQRLMSRQQQRHLHQEVTRQQQIFHIQQHASRNSDNGTVHEQDRN
ncbi:uncharacterized protein LOC131681699 [Topomyia yanbarensis]|uniref:uncharacterized protein LOC131681699 n=1 Tax=Topomyia yanbarensis TaxID=2498891 RepID=UPI00273BFE37|nr:uncharacterized protein LOC131681699 [Topomyia yanbarensis]XP_058818653.1 uncharacterized protein LOC131681699 [Topomyia yanbarensis]